MSKLQSQGLHHITMVGSNRESTIDFYEGVLGMRFVFEQPNLDVPEENHLYFDMGDGCMLTFFVRPSRVPDPTPNPEGIGNLHHLAFNVSRAVYLQIAQRLDERGIANTGPIDRGFMDSIYFRDPSGQLLEMASYKFEPPAGYSSADVLAVAHQLRVARGAYNIETVDVADAVEALMARRGEKTAAAV